MVCKNLSVAVTALLAGLAAANPTRRGAAAIPSFTAEEITSGKAIQELGRIAYETAMERVNKATSGCTKDNVKIRKEWRNMSLEDRKAYQEAITCLMNSPSRNKDLDPRLTAWDDYGVLHYQQTPYVHNSATFLLWHRHYNWVLEQDMKETCGYTGVFPYWEWGLDCATGIDKSPLFDGSETSLGGGGANGRGCLEPGPFSNLTVNLGPVGSANPLKYNPRCIKRQLNSQMCRNYASLKATTDPILQAPDINTFQAITQGDGRAAPAAARVGMGVHGGGHYSIGGDPGGDFYFSALEPGFYLHHGNIDRMHFIWQNLDWENRQTIAGTNTMFNQPPTPEAVLTDPMIFEPLHRNLTIGDTMDTVGGTPLCYVYEPW